MVGHSTMDCHVRHGCANGRARIPGVALDRAKPAAGNVRDFGYGTSWLCVVEIRY
jgi:hypothetical protein